MAVRNLEIELRNDSASPIVMGTLTIPASSSEVIWDSISYTNGTTDNFEQVLADIGVFNQNLGDGYLVMVVNSEDLSITEGFAQFAELQIAFQEATIKDTFTILRLESESVIGLSGVANLQAPGLFGIDGYVKLGNLDDVAINAHLVDGYNPHSTSIGNLESGTLSELNSAITDATLDDITGTRTPTSHASTHNAGGGDAMAIDAIPGTGSLRTLGSGAQQACAGNDARLSDSRTPTAHATSHKKDGSDEIEISDMGTSETNTLKVLRPNGTGGVVWGSSAAGGASSWSESLGMGNTTDGYNPEISAGDRIQGEDGSDLTFYTSSGGDFVLDSDGTSVTLTATPGTSIGIYGPENPDGDGKSVSVYGGGAADGYNAAGVSIVGGSCGGGGDTGNAGSVTLATGYGNATGNPGNITMLLWPAGTKDGYFYIKNNFVDQFSVSDGYISAHTNRIRHVQDPTDAQDAATKNYVDSQTGTASTWSDVLANGNTTDGYNPEISAGDRIQGEDGNDLVLYTSSSADIVLDANGTDGYVIIKRDGSEVARWDNDGSNERLLSTAPIIEFPASLSTAYIRTSDNPASGGDLYIEAGDGGTGEGGSFNWYAGNSDTDYGGVVNLYAGDGYMGGGQINITAGDGTGGTPGGGGSISVTSGSGKTGSTIALTAGSGSDGSGGSINLNSGSGTTASGQVTVGTAASPQSGPVTIFTGQATGDSDHSGNVALMSGDYTGNSGYAGAAQLVAGDATGTSDVGGAINIEAGHATNSGSTGGSINLDAGNGDTSGGGISITGGDGNNGSAGSCSFGSGTGTTTGGHVSVGCGTVSASSGGNLNLYSGGGSENGGTVNLYAGSGTSGHGGDLYLLSGSGGTYDGYIFIYRGSTEVARWNVYNQLKVNSNRIIDVQDPIDPQDAATKAYIDGYIYDYLPLDGSRAMTGDLDLGGNDVTNPGVNTFSALYGAGTDGTWGDILFRGTSNWERLAASDDGYVLTTHGAGVDPTWEPASGGVTDHGDLDGLGDDDHTQYSLVDGSRAFTNPVGGVTPTDAAHLATKGYVDGYIDANNTWAEILANGNTTGGTSPEISAGDALTIDLSGTPLNVVQMVGGTMTFGQTSDFGGIDIYSATSNLKIHTRGNSNQYWSFIGGGAELQYIDNTGADDMYFRNQTAASNEKGGAIILDAANGDDGYAGGDIILNTGSPGSGGVDGYVIAQADGTEIVRFGLDNNLLMLFGYSNDVLVGFPAKASGNGVDLSISAQDTDAAAVGGSLTLTSGACNSGSGQSGEVILSSGTAPSLSGNVTVTSGSSTTGTSGHVYLKSADANGPGDVYVTGGAASGSGPGNILITSGGYTGGGSGGGSFINITSGSAVGSGAGGTITINAGSGAGDSGGNVQINAGTGSPSGQVKLAVAGSNKLILDGSTIDARTQRVIDVVDPVDSQDAATKNYVDGYTTDLFDVTNEPSGFPNITDSTISVVAATRTFTIQPTASSYDVLFKGRIVTKTSVENTNWTDVEGLHFFYFDSNASLQHTISESVILDVLYGDGNFISALYWNATDGYVEFWAEERHGFMPGPTHVHFHSAFGAQWVSGGALGDMDAGGSGDNDSSAQFSVGTVTIRDEDLSFTWSDGSPQEMSPIAEIPIYYRSGASGDWRKKPSDAFNIIYSGTAGYTGGSGRVAYNEYTGATWQLTEVGEGKYVLVHYYATDEIDEPIIGILGQNEYSSAADATAGATNEINDLQGTADLLSLEHVALATTIWESKASFGNTPAARIVQTTDGFDYVDWRGSTRRGVGGVSGVTSHANLSGLLEDDHPQYLLVDGTRAMSGTLNLDGYNIINVADPTNPQHAATKNYVDGYFSSQGWAEVLVIGNTSGGTDPIISTGDTIRGETDLDLAAADVTGAIGYSVNITAGSALTATYDGGDIVLTSGDTAGGSPIPQDGEIKFEIGTTPIARFSSGKSITSSQIGYLSFDINNNNAGIKQDIKSSGSGTDFTIQAQIAPNNAGGLNLYGGNSITDGTGGDVEIKAGYSTGVFKAGNVNITSGYSNGGAGTAGDIIFTTGNGTTKGSIWMYQYATPIMELDGTTIDVKTQRIENVVNPSNAQDAATKAYIDGYVDSYLPLNGSRAMTGNLNMGTHYITNVVNPNNPQDAATKNYVDGYVDNYLPLDGSRSMIGNLDLNTNDITNPGINTFSTLYGAGTDGTWGDILYRGQTNWVRLGAGQDGYVLTTRGSGDNPEWYPAPGAAGGEANVGANLGTDGYGVYDSKSSVTLRFRNIAVVSNILTINYDATDHDIDIGVNESNIDHGSIGGLDGDDHTQYLLVNGTRAMTGNLNMDSHSITNVTDPSNPQDAATKNYVDGYIYSELSSIDHGSLDGLGDDDHTQYILVNGTRAFTGAVQGSTDLLLRAVDGYVRLDSDMDADGYDIINVDVATNDAEYSMGNQSTSLTLNANNGNFQTFNLNGNVTSVTMVPPLTGIGRFQWRIVQNASYTISGWPASVLWPGGTDPTITTGASSIDIITFYWNGTNWYGIWGGDFS